MPYPFVHQDYEACRLRDLHRIEPESLERFNKAEDERVAAFIAEHPELEEAGDAAAA